jgi:hypothetical protein
MGIFLNLFLRIAGPFWRRYQVRHIAGVWEAHKLDGRYVDPNPMLGAGLTTISPRGLLSNVFDVCAYDICPDETRREHNGYIVPDPTCTSRFSRTVHYPDSAEVSHQQIELLDRNNLYVNPAEPDYAKHVLRRVKGQLFLN